MMFFEKRALLCPVNAGARFPHCPRAIKDRGSTATFSPVLQAPLKQYINLRKKRILATALLSHMAGITIKYTHRIHQFISKARTIWYLSIRGASLHHLGSCSSEKLYFIVWRFLKSLYNILKEFFFFLLSKGIFVVVKLIKDSLRWYNFTCIWFKSASAFWRPFWIFGAPRKSFAGGGGGGRDPLPGLPGPGVYSLLISSSWKWVDINPLLHSLIPFKYKQNVILNHIG